MRTDAMVLSSCCLALPVGEAEVLRDVDGAVRGQHHPGRGGYGQRQGARVPGCGRVFFRDPVAAPAIALLALLALQTAQHGPVDVVISAPGPQAFTVLPLLRKAHLSQPVVREHGGA
jgi:hypothetical protein